MADWKNVVKGGGARARGGGFNVLADDMGDMDPLVVSTPGRSGSGTSSSARPYSPGGNKAFSPYTQGRTGNRSPDSPSTPSTGSSNITQGSDMHGFMPVKAGRPRPSRTTELSQRGAPRLSRALAAAAQTCNDRLGRGNRALQKEYEKIQAKAGANRAYNAAENEVNRGKNRYEDVLAFDYNRVLLHHEDFDNWKYINASGIKADPVDYPEWQYIVTQGPLSCTINDFWQMVFEQKSNIILMLTEFEEMTVTRAYIAKSERYMPETADEVVPYGNYLVQLLSKEPFRNFPDIIKRELTIQDMDHNDKLSVTHYQYTHWPDKGIPRDSRAVLELVRILEESETAYKDSHKPGSEKYSGPRPGPPIVHCNSGIGRSGTFLAIDIALRRLRYVNPNSDQDGQAAVSFKDLVIFLRRQRISMVETLDQYRFTYEAVYDAITNGHL